MRLRDKWLQFVRWVSENTSKPVEEIYQPLNDVTNWVEGETAAKADEVKEGLKYATTVGWLSLGWWEQKIFGGVPAVEPGQTAQEAPDYSGIKMLAVVVVVVLLIKKIFF